MWICHLGRHKEEEVRVVRHILISQLNVRLIVVLEDVLLEDGLKGGIQSFANVFKQNWVAQLDCSLGNVQEFGVRKFDHSQIVVLFLGLDPLVALGLRVNNQRPSWFGVCRNNTIINGQFVSWQPLNGPLSNFDRISQEWLNGEIGRETEVFFPQELLPPPQQLHAILLRETACVWEESGSQNRISKHILWVTVQLLNRLLPSFGLVGQTDNQFVCSLQF